MKTRRSVTLLLTFLLMLSTWGMFSVAAGAAKAKAPECVKKQTIKLTKPVSGEDYNEAGYICIKNLAANAKITSVKSSNKMVTAVSMVKDHGFNAIRIQPKNAKVKDGTKSTITIKVRQNKKTYTLTCVVTLKYVSPIKTLQLGNGKYKNLSNTKVLETVDDSGLKLVMEKGYRIKSVIVMEKPSYSVDEDGNVCIASSARKYSAKQLDMLQFVRLSSVKRIIVNYVASTKPANYKAPKHWKGTLDSPLDGCQEIIFE